ncbi:restriction endonuclease subunit S [Halobacteriales archaeon Cl-PHB]
MSEDATLDDFTDSSKETTVTEDSQIETNSRFGKLPQSWELYPLKEVGEIAGRTAPEKDDSECWDGEIPWATPSEITSLTGPTISDTEEHLTDDALEKVSSNLLPPASVLLTTRATIGECAVNTVEMTTNQGFKNLIPGDRLGTWYAYYRLENEGDYLASLSKGSTFPEVGKDTVKNFVVPVPPLEEQRKIASILYNVDQAIQKTEEIIDKWEKVKSGLLQDIFRYGIDSNGQLRSHEDDSCQKTKYGLVPEGWEITPLKNIVPDNASITYGIVKPGEHHSGGVPVVKVENITDGNVQTNDLLHTDPDIHEKYDRAELKEGDLLFTIRGTVGRMAFVPESLEGGNLTQDTARIRVNGANPRFVRYYLETSTPNNYFERHTKGQAVQGINLEDLQEVPVHLPSREEQERIVEILDTHTDLIQGEREYRDQLQRLKQGIMQDLLSGTVRTTDTNIEVVDEVAQHG